MRAVGTNTTSTSDISLIGRSLKPSVQNIEADTMAFQTAVLQCEEIIRKYP